MQKPYCHDCRTAHWLGDPHAVPVNTHAVPDIQTDVPEKIAPVTHGVTHVTHATVTHGSRSARWRAAHPEAHAQQQRAYRARKK